MKCPQGSLPQARKGKGCSSRERTKGRRRGAAGLARRCSAKGSPGPRPCFSTVPPCASLRFWLYTVWAGAAKKTALPLHIQCNPAAFLRPGDWVGRPEVRPQQSRAPDKVCFLLGWDAIVSTSTVTPSNDAARVQEDPPATEKLHVFCARPRRQLWALTSFTQAHRKPGRELDAHFLFSRAQRQHQAARSPQLVL